MPCSSRGEAAEGPIEEAIEHGQQRYRDGYSVVQLLRELQIFRRVLANMACEIVEDESAEQVQLCRNLSVDIIGRSMNSSVAEYTRAAEDVGADGIEICIMSVYGALVVRRVKALTSKVRHHLGSFRRLPTASH